MTLHSWAAAIAQLVEPYRCGSTDLDQKVMSSNPGGGKHFSEKRKNKNVDQKKKKRNMLHGSWKEGKKDVGMEKSLLNLICLHVSVLLTCNL